MAQAPENRPQSIWKTRPRNQSATEQISGKNGIGQIVASILTGRGVNRPEDAAAFLDPRLAGLNNPLDFADMAKAAARVANSVQSRENVCVYGDYDADGMTSTALLKLYLKKLGLDVRTFLPEREADGYGLHQSRLAELAQVGVTLVICVDCGIKSIEAVNFGTSLGMDLVILDHHTPGPELPDACAVVDPHRADCPFPFKDLSAVGIAFYFCGALRRELVSRGCFQAPGPDFRDLLDLVAIGTVADVMPLVADNRIFVRAGLDRINSSPRPGIAALKAVSEVKGLVTSGNISFKMAPRLNASGRMSHPDTSLNLLISDNDREAATWAEMLEVDNSIRREVGAQVLDDARRQILEAGGPDGGAIVVAGQEWHQGVLGIVAARLVDEFQVPAVVLSIVDQVATGSARSVEGLDIGSALASLDEMLLRNGGHPMAAGLSLKMSLFDKFRTAFKAIVAGVLKEGRAPRTQMIDAVVRLPDIDSELASALQALEPFGMGNPEPVFASRAVTVVSTRKVGRDGSHLRIGLFQDGHQLDAIWFQGADSGLAEGELIDVAYSVSADTRGLSVKIREARPHAPDWTGE